MNLLDQNHLVSFYYRYSYFVLTYRMDLKRRLNLNHFRLIRLTHSIPNHHLEYDVLVRHLLRLRNRSPIADLNCKTTTKKKRKEIMLKSFLTPWKQLKSQVPNPIDCFKSNYVFFSSLGFIKIDESFCIRIRTQKWDSFENWEWKAVISEA